MRLTRAVVLGSLTFAVATTAVATTAVLATAATVRGSSVDALDDAELVRRARTIVHADVTRVRADWDPAHTRIFTVVELTPRETLKGEARPLVTLKLPGGEKDGVTTLVHGMPVFAEGEEVVVFATAPHETSGVCLPVGLGQGKWSVARDATGRKIARRTLGGAKVVVPQGQPEKPFRTEVALDDLLATVRAEVAKQKADAEAKAGARAPGSGDRK